MKSNWDNFKKKGRNMLNKKEAPDGFIAVLKEDYIKHEQNLCNFCEWRKQCQDEKTDKTIHNHRCMGYTVVTDDKKEISRMDGCSVLFLKKTEDE